MWLKRTLCLGLISSMAIGLCACGGGGGKNENSALAKENVYKMQEIALPEIDGDDFNVFASTHKDGTVHLLMQVYHWNDEKFSENPQTDIRLMSIKEDGSDVQMLELEIPEWERQSDQGAPGATNGGPVPRTEAGDAADPAAEPEAGTEAGEDGTEGDTADSAAEPEDGTDTEGEGTPEDGSDTQPEGEDDTAGEPEGETQEGIADDAFAVEPEYVPQDIWENSNYNNFVFGADGKIYALRNYSYSDYANEIYTEKTYLNSWNTDGKHQWEKELEGLRSEEEYLSLIHI